MIEVSEKVTVELNPQSWQQLGTGRGGRGSFLGQRTDEPVSWERAVYFSAVGETEEARRMNMEK